MHSYSRTNSEKFRESDTKSQEYLPPNYALRIQSDRSFPLRSEINPKGTVFEVSPCSRNKVSHGDLVVATLSTSKELFENNGNCEVDIWRYVRLKRGFFLAPLRGKPQKLEKAFTIFGKAVRMLTEEEPQKYMLVE